MRDKKKHAIYSEEEIDYFIRESVSTGKSLNFIKRGLKKYNLKGPSVDKLIRDYYVRHILLKPLFWITLILIIPSLVLFAKPPTVGRGYLLPVNLTESFEYVDSVGLIVGENYNYSWNVSEIGNLTSVGISGKVSKQGYAKVYLVDGEDKYLVFDSTELSLEYFSPITGFATLSTENESNNVSNIKESVDIVINDSVINETSNETIEFNETPINETILVNETNVTVNDTINDSLANISLNGTVNESLINDSIINGSVLINETNVTFENDTILNITNVTSDKVIVVNLGYETLSEYDIDNNGIEPIDGIIDFSVKDSIFNWSVNYGNLCTEWEVYSEGSSTFVCYGSSLCCNFIGLTPSFEGWNDSFNLNYGKYDSGLNNTVSAKVIYVDYSLDPLDPYEDITFSELESLDAVFEVESYSYEGACIETCSLPNLNSSNYTLEFEVNNATLNIDEIYYSLNQVVSVENIYNISVLNDSALQYDIVINQPVKWVKKIKLDKKAPNLTVQIPRYVTNISVKKIENGRKRRVVNVTIEVGSEVADLDTYNLVTGGAFRTDLVQINENGLVTKVFDWFGNIGVTGFARLFPDEKNKNSTLVIKEKVKEVEIEYYTEGPKSKEEKVNNSVKRVVISSELHYESILAYSVIESEARDEEVHLYWLVNNSRKEIAVEKFDVNENGLVDYVQWIVPSLSNQTYEIIIKIVRAQHLDENRTVIADIFDYVKEKDNNWSEPVYTGQYVRVTFEQNLTRENDISIFARSNESAEIEVYEKGSDVLITTFETIGELDWYKVYLTTLRQNESIDTFDLKVNGIVEFDQIIDPTIIIRDVTIDSDLDNITAERNFTHLEISDDYPYDKLELYMPFDVNESENTSDYTLRHNDGLLKNGAVYNSSGKYGGGIYFDGLNDFINVTDSSSLEVNKVSISFWFRPDIDYDSSTGYASFVYHSDYEVYLDAEYMVFDFKGNKINFSGSSWNKNTWYHVVATYDGTTRLLYIDGSNRTTVIISPAFSVQNSSGETVAVFSDTGDLTIRGRCVSNIDCEYPGDDTFVIQNDFGETVAYINRTGDLCIEDADCNDDDSDCYSHGDGAFIIQDTTGDDISFINATGDLCLTGGLVTEGNP